MTKKTYISISRAISSVLIFCMLFMDVALAADPATVAAAWSASMLRPSTASSSDAAANLNSRDFPLFELPKGLGTIESYSPGRQNGQVIHIQDLHVNEDAQLKIASLIDYLSKHLNVRLIQVEGASGEIAHHLLSLYPDEKVRKVAGRSLLLDGFLTGPEYLAVSQRPDLVLNGVEDPGLYEKNRQALVEITKHKDMDSGLLTPLRKKITALDTVILNPVMSKWLRKQKAFREDYKNMASYIELIHELCPAAEAGCRSPQMTLLLEIHEIEKKLDKKKLTEELARLLPLPPGGMTALHYEKLETLIARSLQRPGHDKGDLLFWSKFIEKPQKKEAASHALLFFDLLEKSCHIDSGLFDEIEIAEETLARILPSSGDELELYRLHRICDIYEKMFSLSMTRRDAEFLYENRHSFEASRLRREIDGLIENYALPTGSGDIAFEEIEKSLGRYETFYDYALLRDKKLIENTFEGMKHYQQEATILVTGGFHTAAIERRLRREGMGFVTIMPYIDKPVNALEDEKIYEHAMQLSDSPLTKLITRSILPLSDKRFQLQIPDRLPLTGQLQALIEPFTGKDLRRLMNEDFHVDSLVHMMTVFTLTGGLTGTETTAGDLLRVSASLSPGEKTLLDLVYMPFHQQRAIRISERNGRGRLLSGFNSHLGFAMESWWRPYALGASNRHSGVSNDILETVLPPGIVARTRLLNDPLLYESRRISFLRDQERQPKTELRVNETEIPAEDTESVSRPALTAEPALKKSSPKSDVAETKAAETILKKAAEVAAAVPARTGDILLSFLVLQALFFSTIPFYWITSAALIRTGYSLALLIHEWAHIAAAAPAGSAGLKNFMGNRSAGDWLRALLPFLPPVNTAQVTTAEEPSAKIRARALRAGWLVSLVYAAAVISSLFFAPALYFWLLAAMAPGAAAVLIQALVSDLFFPDESRPCTFNCGDQGILARKQKSDKGLMPERFEKILYRMGQVTKIRGEQAAGRVTSSTAGLIRTRRLNPKRAHLNQTLQKGAQKTTSWQSFFGARHKEQVFTAVEHYRYGTSSAPAVNETHPHQWSTPRKSRRWQISNGKLLRQNIRRVHAITHNGDFDYWNLFGKDMSFQHVGLWLERVLYTPNDTRGDSPKIAGMIDLLHTQGMWEASVRLAYQWAIANYTDAFDGQMPILPSGHDPHPRQPKNTAPTRKMILQWAEAFEEVFEYESVVIANLELSDLSQIPDEIRAKMASRALARIKQINHFKKIPAQKLEAFVRETVDAFLDNDFNTTVQKFMKGAKGSFGLVVFNEEEPDHVILASRGQPLTLGFDPDEELILYASEPAAIKVALNERGRTVPYRLDLDQLNGEIVDVSLEGIRVYSETLHREITADELAYSGRIVEMHANPYISWLPSQEGVTDIIQEDLTDIPGLIHGIHDDWKHKKHFNRQTAEAFVSQLAENAVDSSDDDYDLIVMGIETSRWLADQFVQDLESIFPKLRIKMLTSNKFLSIANKNKGKFPGMGPKTTILALSQSGQTFPSLMSTAFAQKVNPGRVFIMTGEVDSLMGTVVGQQYYKGAPFSARIFINKSGWRPAEASTITNAATHQTLTELLLYTAKNLPLAAGQDRPFGAKLPFKEVAKLEAYQDFMINQGIQSIIGATIRGDKVKSPEHENLVKQGRLWGYHILEPAITWGMSALYVAITVIQTGPPVTTLFTQWLMPLLSGFAPELLYAAKAVDAMIYVFMPFIFALVLRVMQRRPLLARLGKRTLVIGDRRYVRRLLEAFTSKLFALSYGIASLDVHSDDPIDHMVHHHGHRVTRGTLILLGRPNGAHPESEDDESWAMMTTTQAKGVRNYGAGPEVFSIGHNAKGNPNAFDHSVTLWAPDMNGSTPQAELYETRFASFERLLASYVMLHSMGKTVSRFWPIRYDMSRTQSGTRVATTASPVSASRVMALIQSVGKPGDAEPKKVLGAPAYLPFAVLPPLKRLFSRSEPGENGQNKTAAEAESVNAPAVDPNASGQDVPDTESLSSPAAVTVPAVEIPQTPAISVQETIVPEATNIPPTEPAEIVPSSVSETAPVEGVVPPLETEPVRPAVAEQKSTQGKTTPAPAAQPISTSLLLIQHLTLLNQIRGRLPYGYSSDDVVRVRTSLGQWRDDALSRLHSAQINGSVLKSFQTTLDERENAFMAALKTELRRSSSELGEALAGKARMQNQILLQEYFNFSTYLSDLKKAGFNPQDVLSVLHDAIRPQYALGTQPLESGEIILNYRESMHSEAFAENLHGILLSHASIQKLYVIRDKETSAEAWQTFKHTLESNLHTFQTQIVFIEASDEHTIPSLMAERLKERGITAQNSVQLLDPAALTSPHELSYYETAFLDAALLGRETIVILGAREAVSNVNSFGFGEAVGMALNYFRLVAVAA